LGRGVKACTDSNKERKTQNKELAWLKLQN
jgi:hypothetical protein